MRQVLAIVIMSAIGCGAGMDGQIGGGDDDGTGGDNGNGGSGESFAACKHVDVVIAVDNSGSMKEEKADLRDIAFPGFAASLINVAGGLDDFRVGTLDACSKSAGFHTSGTSGACNFDGGNAWIESSSSKLVDEFKCVGDISSAGTACTGDNDDEQPASTATAALEPEFMGPGKANEGFLRDDALLVVVAITDEDEQPTPGADAQEVYDRLVAIKGDVNKMVFLGIGGASSCDGAYGSAKHATKLEAVTNKFIAAQRGVFWDLCQGNLDQGLTQALTVIESACEDFGPIL